MHVYVCIYKCTRYVVYRDVVRCDVTKWNANTYVGFMHVCMYVCMYVCMWDESIFVLSFFLYFGGQCLYFSIWITPTMHINSTFTVALLLRYLCLPWKPFTLEGFEPGPTVSITTAPRRQRAVSNGGLAPGWPEEFVKKSPKMLPNPCFVEINAWT
jgi:hypothetical protein